MLPFARSRRLAGRTTPPAPRRHHRLVLVVEPSGARRWGQRIAIRGRRRELGLGSYPRVSLADARERARKNAAAARDGRDPTAERAVAAVSAVTLEEASRTVHALHAPA